jgi:hypothetical protein
MLPAFVSPEGVPLESGKNTPPPSPEVGTVETTSMSDLLKAAETSARKQSTVQGK